MADPGLVVLRGADGNPWMDGKRLSPVGEVPELAADASDPANAVLFAAVPIGYGDSPSSRYRQDPVIPQDVLEEAWDYAQSQHPYALLVPSTANCSWNAYDRGRHSRTP